MSDILKHVLLVPRQYRLAASITSLSPDEMAPSLKSRFRLTPRGEIINRLLWSIIQRSRSLEHVHVVAGIFRIRVMCSRVPTLENLGAKKYQFQKQTICKNDVFYVHGKFSRNGMKIKKGEAYQRFCMHFWQACKEICNRCQEICWVVQKLKISYIGDFMYPFRRAD
jgi:hypothetical protein